MRVFLLLALAMHLLMGTATAATGFREVALSAHGSFDLLPHALLLRDAGGDFPVQGDAGAVATWSASQPRAAAVAASGGAYWLVTTLRNDSATDSWVLYPNDTLINTVEARLYGDDGSVQQVVTGFAASHPYLLHYAGELRLRQGHRYQLVVRFASPYFVRAPRFAMREQADFRRTVARENVIVIGALGALGALALYNFFIFCLSRRSAYLHYSLYVLCYGLAWALPFNVFADLFDWRMVGLHYIPFFLLPVFSTLFYLRFLELKTLAPRLAAISRINIVLPLLLLPSSFLAIGVAHRLATVMLAFYMVLALLCGIYAWWRGFQPARYFVLAYIAVLSPGVLVLAANLGLLPAADYNMPMLVLVGGTVDALLLAFALAAQIRLLGDQMELTVAARTDELVKANLALTRAKEHAEVVSRHRIDFLSAMSHDIRTPMAGVIGMLKLGLRDPAVRGETADYLRIGLRSGESLLVILNDILDYSKIDAGKLTLESTSFDLARVTADATAILQGQAEAKGLLLRAASEDGLPRFVMGDPTRVRQILVNLLGNAIKFTDAGEVLLTVRSATASEAAPRADGSAALVLSVHDTGPGIAADVQTRLFQKFEQGDYSTTRRYGGTGLGLAICKELVGLMGGTISVASTVGIGSRFDVVLPLAAAASAAANADDEGRAPAVARANAISIGHTRQLRILCAEDVGTNQIIIRALLGAMGHQVVIVENGVEAMQALAADDYDMVLMDGRMPRMDGAQATALIRAGQAAPAAPLAIARNRRVPIIALTANASDADCQRYLAAGMDGFLSKPVDEKALHALITTTITQLDAAATAAATAVGADADKTDAAAAPAALAEAAAPVVMLPLKGLSAAHMQRIASAFLAEAPRRLAEATAALAAGRPLAAAEAFHALKGSAAYLSSPRLQRLAASLERRAEAGAVGSGDAELAALAAAVDEAVHGVRVATATDPIL
ncbi:7TM diverse intracellular signaling domain-containing protein [Massilia sp. PWRC2]|uniref:7TM diverse intracellular signaling domain-containing protein n=1 Tax=Massilia sp. PWRC2 TaxID=2804626 RepID=UPI003CFA90B4